MSEPGRVFKLGTSEYRYSINGQEKEKGLNDNITSAEYWEYDSRIGRRWNTDPVIKENESPYAAFNNNPVLRIDPTGLDGEPYKVKKGDNLSKIAKRVGGGATAESLAKLNKIKDPNKIKVGQMITVGSTQTPIDAASYGKMLGKPEVDFKEGPLTGYNNSKSGDFKVNATATVESLGTYFISTHIGSVSQQNTVIVAGPLLEEIKRLPSVYSRIMRGGATLFADGKFEPGEYYQDKYRMTDLQGADGNRMMFQVLDDVAHGKNFKASKFFSAEYWLGSYDFSMRVSADGKQMVICVYDSKTIESATDRKGFLQRNLPIPDNPPPTYQRYLWFVPLK